MNETKNETNCEDEIPDECGFMLVEDRWVPVGLVAYDLFCGDVPPGSAVVRTCGNPTCVNPDHLRLVRPGESPADAVKKPAERRADVEHPRRTGRGRKRTASADRSKPKRASR